MESNLRYETVNFETIYIVEHIIQKSFEKQARILAITKEEYPNYVAFESTDKIEKSILNGSTIVLAFLDNKPIGTIRYNIDTNQHSKGYINRLAVLPKYRGNRYGESLMKFAEARLIELNVKMIEISIVASFENLKKFYEKLGYVSKEQKVFSTLPFKVLFMKKDF